jgi:hypothetical protein
MTIEQFSASQLRASPWKNGGGVTREVVAMPRGSGLADFAWRVSIADISMDSAFSQFPGVARVITLLEGDGVELRSADGDVVHRLDRLFEPFPFAGEAQLAASLLGGPSTDFNVMTRRGDVEANVRVVREHERQPAASAGLLFVARGICAVQPIAEGDLDNSNQPEWRLTADTGLWWADETIAWRVDVEADGDVAPVLLAVHIRPAPPTRGARLHYATGLNEIESPGISRPPD